MCLTRGENPSLTCNIYVERHLEYLKVRLSDVELQNATTQLHSHDFTPTITMQFPAVLIQLTVALIVLPATLALPTRGTIYGLIRLPNTSQTESMLCSGSCLAGEGGCMTCCLAEGYHYSICENLWDCSCKN